MGYELFDQRDALARQLAEAIHMMARYGNDYAAAEANYKVEVAKEAIRMRDEGMAVTMINMVIHGTGRVPKMRMDRDVADVMYKTAQENIQSIKLQLRLVEAQIEREWAQAKREV